MWRWPNNFGGVILAAAKYAGIAQLVERHIRNVEVLGSTPSTGTNSVARDAGSNNGNDADAAYQHSLASMPCHCEPCWPVLVRRSTPQRVSLA